MYSSVLLEWLRHREWDNERMQHAKKWWEIIKKHLGLETIKRFCYTRGNPVIKYILKKACCVGTCPGLIWLRIGTNGPTYLFRRNKLVEWKRSAGNVALVLKYELNFGQKMKGKHTWEATVRWAGIATDIKERVTLVWNDQRWGFEQRANLGFVTSGRRVLGQLSDRTVYSMQVLCSYWSVEGSKIFSRHKIEAETLPSTHLAAFA